MIGRMTKDTRIINAQRVKFEQGIKGLINDAIEITAQNRKEVGIWACGNRQGSTIHLNGGILSPSSGFDARSFKFDMANIPSIERSACHQGDRLLGLLHTHPDGNHFPSQRDRFTSMTTDMLGCVIGSVRSSCYIGDNDLSVR